MIEDKELIELLGADFYNRLNSLSKDVKNQTNVEKIKSICKVLYANGFDLEFIKKNRTILEQGDAQKIENIIQVFKESPLGLDILKSNGHILAQGNPETIKKIIELFQRRNIDFDILRKNAYILVQGKPEKISDIFDALAEKGLGRKKVEECPNMLIKTTGKNIRRVYNILSEYGLVKLLDEDINILQANPKNLEQLLHLYEREGLLSAMMNNPSRLYTNSYSLVSSRIRYLNQKNDQLTYVDENGKKRLNSDLFIKRQAFQEKYGINSDSLEKQYGPVKTTIKKALKKALKDGVNKSDLAEISKIMDEKSKEKEEKEINENY